MNLRCPFCHARGPVEAYTQDEAARQLLGLAFRGVAPRSLLAYLTLFRSDSRDLAWDRALKLAGQVMELGADPLRLEAALQETVEAIRAKRDRGQGEPLKNHNYLKRVLESIGDVAQLPAHHVADAGKMITGKTATAMNALQAWAGGDPIRQAIAEGLQALLALPLKNRPGADTVTLTADVWHLVLDRAGINVADVDAPRIRTAFTRLLQAAGKDFPEPAALKPHLPKRPERTKIDEPLPDQATKKKHKEELQKIREGL